MNPDRKPVLQVYLPKFSDILMMEYKHMYILNRAYPCKRETYEAIYEMLAKGEQEHA